MTILIDPGHNESDALFNLVPDWKDKSVLEIGSGDGRLTWRFADKVAQVVAIEPSPEKHAAALVSQQQGFEHVRFVNLGLDTFARTSKEKFDIAILSWSL